MTEHDHEPNTHCREMLSKLYEYLDGELSASDREQVLAHLEACRPCLNRFEFERLFHEYIQAKAPRPEARAEFKADLLSRIRAESQQSAGGAGESRSHVRLMPRFALAASLLLFIVAGSWWMTRQRTSEAADWQLLADYYYHRVDVPEDGIETNCPIESRKFIVSRLGEETGRAVPEAIPAGLTVEEACVMPWKSARIAVLEWRAESDDVSFIVAPASSIPIGNEPTREWNGRSYHVVSKDGLNAVCWEEAGGYVCVMMAPSDFGTMFSWAEAVRKPGGL